MKALSFPFTLDPFGVAETTTDQTKIYTDRLVTLLSTAIGERPMRPTYGTDIATAMFENQGIVQTAIRQAIIKAVGVWVPEVTIEKVNVGSVEDTGQVRVELLVTLPDYTSTVVNISTATLNPDATITR